MAYLTHLRSLDTLRIAGNFSLRRASARRGVLITGRRVPCSSFDNILGAAPMCGARLLSLAQAGRSRSPEPRKERHSFRIGLRAVSNSITPTGLPDCCASRFHALSPKIGKVFGWSSLCVCLVCTMDHAPLLNTCAQAAEPVIWLSRATRCLRAESFGLDKPLSGAHKEPPLCEVTSRQLVLEAGTCV